MSLHKVSFLTRLVNRHVPITRIKILVARFLHACLKIAMVRDLRVVNRRGINLSLDLSEGIDLSLFLFGSFQNHVVRATSLIAEDSIIFDVGANTGVMSLKFAAACPRATIFAFEPTYFGCEKLKKNLELNPLLATRITLTQTFVADLENAGANLKAYASWNLNFAKNEDRDEVHHGLVKDTTSVGAVSLDGYVTRSQLNRVDFIKIDTDGYEGLILQGSRQLIEKFRPYIVFELGGHAIARSNVDIFWFVNFFQHYNYSLNNVANLFPLSADTIESAVPRKGTIDVIAVPVEKKIQFGEVYGV